jgi:hypothetical protein
LSNFTTADVRNVTIHSNTASSHGGGVFNAGAALLINNATITDNQAPVGAGTSGVSGIHNSILIDNRGVDCAGFVSVSSRNLIGVSECFRAEGYPQATGPVLDTLTLNGGPTPTRRVLVGSVAHDADLPPILAGAPACEGVDQRGVRRSAEVTAACDLGAFEISDCLNGVVQPDTGEDCDRGVQGSGVCCNWDCSFHKPDVVCRESVGICDREETCSGAAPDCPTDQLHGPDVVCRAAVGICDQEETCSGEAADCPTDQVAPRTKPCRAARAVCDEVESCDGENNDCPEDTVVARGTECRPPTNECDRTEECDGERADCPPDQATTAGQICSDDGLPCTLDLCDGSATICTHPEISFTDVERLIRDAEVVSNCIRATEKRAARVTRLLSDAGDTLERANHANIIRKMGRVSRLSQRVKKRLRVARRVVADSCEREIRPCCVAADEQLRNADAAMSCVP